MRSRQLWSFPCKRLGNRSFLIDSDRQNPHSTQAGYIKSTKITTYVDGSTVEVFLVTGSYTESIPSEFNVEIGDVLMHVASQT